MNGQAPGQILFARETGISAHLWRGKFWARWGDALSDAGFGPNNWTPRLDPNQIILEILGACRHYGKFPTNSELGLLRQSNQKIPFPATIRKHFGNRSGLVAALVTYLSTHEDYADVAVMLPSVKRVAEERSATLERPKEGFVYLIQSGAFYKIGRSDDIERRVKEIRISLPVTSAMRKPMVGIAWLRRLFSRERI